MRPVETLGVPPKEEIDGLPMDDPTLPTSRPPIQDFLDHVDIGPDDSMLTLKIVANRKAWRRVFCEGKKDHSLGFIALDRSPYNTYKALMTYDTAPVFTRQNHTIMIFGKEQIIVFNMSGPTNFLFPSFKSRLQIASVPLS